MVFRSPVLDFYQVGKLDRAAAPQLTPSWEAQLNVQEPLLMRDIGAVAGDIEVYRLLGEAMNGVMVVYIPVIVVLSLTIVGPVR
jgi:hypothetical protein